MKQRQSVEVAPSIRTIDEAKAVAEKAYQRFKAPAAKWISMAMLTLSTEGCMAGIQFGGALVGDPDAARLDIKPGFAPSIGRNERGEDQTGKGGAMMVGIEAKPRQPEDSQWWNKGEGIYDSKEVYALMDSVESGSASEQQKQRLKDIREGKLAGYLSYGPLGPRPTQSIAIVQQRTKEIDIARPPIQGSIADKKSPEAEAKAEDRRKGAIRGALIPKLVIEEPGSAMPKLRLDTRTLREPLSQTVSRGIQLLLPKIGSESGIRVVPHESRPWATGNPKKNGEEQIAFRLEEIPTIIPTDVNTIEQKMLRDAFVAYEKGGKVISEVEHEKVYEDEKQKSVVIRIGLPDLEQNAKETREVEATLPFIGEIRGLQTAIRNGGDTDQAIQKLRDLEKRLETWKANVSEKEVEFVPGKAMRSARLVFSTEKIKPLERELSVLKMNIANAESLRPVQAGSDAWAKVAVMRIQAKEKEAELAKLYVEREQIPEDKKVEIDVSTMNVISTKSASEKKADKMMRDMLTKWQQLGLERQTMVEKARRLGFESVMTALGSGTQKPMRFHVRIDEEHGLLAVIGTMEK